MADLSAIARCHRIQNSPGYGQAADHVERRAREAGLTVARHRFGPDASPFWTQIAFPAWNCRSARLELLVPGPESLPLADFAADPLSIVQRSAATPPGGVEAELLVLDEAGDERAYAGLDVAGKIVLARGDPMRVHRLAVLERGALGLVFDPMNEIPGLRTRQDLAAVRQYTSFWWEGQEPRGFGFVLTPEQGDDLRERERAARLAGTPLRMRAVVDASFSDGAIEVLDALLPGDGAMPLGAAGTGNANGEEVWCLAHLCHPAPFCNDNASGAAAALAAAGALAAAVRDGLLPAPRRAVRFLWMPEMTGTTAYLAHAGAIRYGRAVAALNLDMVGEDESRTGGALNVEHPPLATPSYAGYLLAECVRAACAEHASLGGSRRVPAARWAETAFAGGSDHMITSDPSVGIATPMLIHWPDRFYHTGADTPDKVDPRMLARSAAIAAAYLAFLATAGEGEAAWLASSMAASMPRELHDACLERWNQGWRGGKLNRYARYRKDKQLEALRSVARLVPEPRREAFAAGALAPWVKVLEAAWEAEVAWWRRAEEDERATGGAAASGCDGTPGGGPARYGLKDLLADTGWSAPDFGAPVRRLHPGPVALRGHLARLPLAQQAAWDRFLDAHPAWAQWTHLVDYAMDGRLLVAEVSEAVEWDTGVRDDEFAMGYVALLAHLGLVAFV